MKITTKLAIGFSAILLLVVLLGGLAFYQTNQLWQGTKNLHDHPMIVSNAVRDIRANILAMHRSMRDVAMAKDDLQLAQTAHQVDHYEDKVLKLFDRVYKAYLGKPADIRSAHKAFVDWRLIRDEVFQLRRAGKFSQAAEITRGKGARHVELMMTKIQKMIDFANSKRVEFYTEAQDRKNSLTIQLWIALMAIVLLTIAVSFVILKGVATPLKALTRVAKQHSGGRYEVRSSLVSTNEIGLLAGAINQMAEAIQQELTIKNSVSAIADSMLAKNELPSFCQALLKSILSTTNSQIGAIYFFNQETSCFEHYYSIGLLEDKIKSFSAHTHEGEFGRALLEKKIVRITSIPEDTPFDFATVTGNFRPREIISIPILQGDCVIALLSLASLQGYSHQSTEIINHAWNGLTSGINGILAFEKARIYSAELDQQNRNLQEQTSELKLQADELQEQNIELEWQKKELGQANKLKTEFLSNMSHELRTPLNSVIALSGVLNRKLKDQIPAEEHSYIDIIEKNGKLLLNLINDILDLSRIEAGKEEIMWSQFSLREMVQAILMMLTGEIQKKNIQVNNQLDGDMPLITSDSTKCRHILQNIIGNAIKFTEKGSVTISGNREGGKFSITVTDTGIGIGKEEQIFIFDEFRQADGTTSRHYGGTGLGLAIAKKYTQMLGGTIDVHSEGGKGSSFTITLPARVPDQLENPPLETFGPGISTNLPRPAKGESVKILVVEDSEGAMIQISDILKDQGYSVECALNGQSALKSLKEHIPHGIILDLMMPGMDGFEILEKIRASEETSKIPVLILTAKKITQSDFKRLKANHIYQLVQKGNVCREELLSLVQNMLNPNPQTALPKSKPSRKGKKATILIVEDNLDNLKTAKALLGEKYNLWEAMDGQEGLEKAKTLRPDLILLDISLPKMDGFQVLDGLKKDKTLEHIPVVALTARAMKGDREEILEYGFDDYISKPIDPKVFLKTIQKWLGE